MAISLKHLVTNISLLHHNHSYNLKPGIMLHNRIFITSSTIFCLFFGQYKSYAQLSIAGPTCVVANRQYQYVFNGDWADSNAIQFCINGGVIVGNDSGSNCKIGVAFNWARVIWGEVLTGNLQLTVAGQNSSLDITLTTDLLGGLIDSSLRIQTLPSTAVPSTIRCTLPTGGSCSPKYTYQWQSSPDNLTWVDISGANNDTLSFIAPVIQTTYYRRKVIEIVSNTVDYSNAGLIVINNQ